MPIDPRIAMSFQAPQIASPMDLAQNAFALKGAMQQNALAEAKMAEMQRQQQSQNALRQLFAGGQMPKAADVYAIDPELGSTYEKNSAETRRAEAAAAASEAERAGSQYKNESAKFSDLLNLISSAKRDPRLYKINIALAKQRGFDVSQVPPEYDENWVNAAEQAVLTVKNRFDIEDKAAVRTETGRHNRAMEGIQSQQEARQGTPDPIKLRREATTLRKEFDALPEVKDFKAALPVLISARNAPDTAAGDIDLAYAVGKIYDPKSVVRESEQKLVYTTGSVLQKLLGGANVALTGGTRLPPEVRQKLLNALNNRVLQFRQAYDQTRGTYEGYANQSGFDPVNVVGQHPASAYKPPAPPQDGGNWKDVP